MAKFVITILILLPFLIVGLWHLVYIVHRNHRLKKLADEREQKKLMAEDLAQLLKDTEQLSIGFTEYFEAGHPKRSREAKQTLSIPDESRN